MGIRFECPNGHKLNVKVFLAGKRGICPDCDAKFVIPLISGGQATAVQDEVEPITQTPPTTAPTAPVPVVAPPAAPGSTAPAQAEQSAQPEVWYVRPAKGDVQYGPATTQVMQSWIAEERIAADSWIWKTGWSEWKFGREAFAELSLPESKIPQAPATNHATVIQLETHTSVDSIAKKLPRRNRQGHSPQSRRQRAQKVTVVLGALVLLLGIAVTLMLINQ